MSALMFTPDARRIHDGYQAVRLSHRSRIASLMCDTCTGIPVSRPIVISHRGLQKYRSSLRIWLMYRPL
jgi:hypothetical protein